MSDFWNAKLYDDKHNFVWQMGAGVVDLLDPQPGEIILDLGCGTGHLTSQIADRGAQVIGFDPSAKMLEIAKAEHPNIDFREADARDFDFPERFDAVFSNAVLHWIHQPKEVIERVYHHLKPRGRFVAEFGGKGNVSALETAMKQAASNLDLKPFKDQNYFPSIAEYAGWLEQGGLEVTFATLFDRSTPLDGEHGARVWMEQFRGAYLDTLSLADQEAILDEAEKLLAPTLLGPDGWFADYRRLRFVAKKVN